ncbi:MAG: hypothetical protein R3332_08395 [Pseudohongiellaceae bacterium]|nr:hypothetical protein [Pseudohongiellaceae bacterium]
MDQVVDFTTKRDFKKKNLSIEKTLLSDYLRITTIGDKKQFLTELALWELKVQKLLNSSG